MRGCFFRLEKFQFVLLFALHGLRWRHHYQVRAAHPERRFVWDSFQERASTWGVCLNIFRGGGPKLPGPPGIL